jgi:hypothetical protein
MIGRLLVIGFCLLTVGLPDTASGQAGVLVYETELHQRPPFYKGPMPLRYRAGKRSLGMGMDIVYWHEFAGWRNSFSYSGVMILESARATGGSGQLVAEATMVRIDREARRIIFRERHYSSDGRVAFECLGSYSIGLGFKLSETETRGTKTREFFFILPV